MLCQYCLDRQIEPEEAIGLYQHKPIGELCLGVIMDNDTQVIHEVQDDDPKSLAARKARAFEVLDKFEELFDGWELYEDEVLLSRDDFFNHKPPALVNLTPEQIKRQISRRKAVLFAFRIKDERYTEIINSIRINERREAGLASVAKSIKETTKKSAVAKDKNAKLAKAFGVSLAELEAIGAKARAEEFKGVKPELSKWEQVKPVNEVRETLTQLQQQIKAQTTDQTPVTFSAKTVKRCETCRKLTCICIK